MLKKGFLLNLCILLMLSYTCMAQLTVSTVDTNVFNTEHSGSSLAIAPDNQPGIAYYKKASGEVRYAKLNEGFWNIDVVEPAEIRAFPSLGFDKNGNPALSYHRADQSLIYAFWNGSEWVIWDLMDNDGWEVSLAFDNQGYPGLSFHNGQDLMYCKLNGTTENDWVCETVDSVSHVCSYTSLAFNPCSGFPVISYYDEGPDDDIKYAVWNGSDWTIRNLWWNQNPSGEETSLAFDKNCNWFMSYQDDVDKILKVINDHGIAINNISVDATSHARSYTSLALNPLTSKPGAIPAVISYYDEGPDHALKVAKCNDDPLNWDIETVSNDAKEKSSLAFDSQGNLAISFFESSTNDLKFGGAYDTNSIIITISVPETATEGDGVLSGQGSVSVNTALTSDLDIILSSNDTSETTVPPAATIPAGSASATFDITIADDSDVDGPQTVTVSATTTTYGDASGIIQTGDNDSDGVTPHGDSGGSSGGTCFINILNKK